MDAKVADLLDKWSNQRHYLLDLVKRSPDHEVIEIMLEQQASLIAEFEEDLRSLRSDFVYPRGGPSS